ncbi:exocyst subunit exo70 family protein B1 [Tasmannia lanceolata]|uniref:exocyst subunit exo70 family protein B1 n=1 Tax=Tasmannia lanceolata TaxID=3420 RepID=UPI004064BE52
MEENGEDKLIAVARHIAKTLGRTETMADDILQIFSAFDGRFSRDKLSDKLEDEDPRDFSLLEQVIRSLDRRISRFVAYDAPIWSDSADSFAFLDAIDELVSKIRDWDPIAAEKPISVFMDRADDLLQQAMFRLEDEFRTLIEQSTESLDPNRIRSDSRWNYSFDSDSGKEEEEDQIPVAHPVPDYDVVIDALPSGSISDLREIAKRMVIAGFGKECSHIYSGYRRDFLDESISRLGLQKRSIEEVQKLPWPDLEDDIDRWIRTANVALRILFPSERRLCDRIFSGISPSVSDLCFMEVCRGTAIQLLTFVEAVSIGSRSPERLFRVLDLFETMRDLMPEFESVFSDHYCASLRTEAGTIWKRLGETIRGIFMELENLIRRDQAKTALPGAGLHPITRYVMNYLRAACGSRQTLEQVLEEENFPSPSVDLMPPSSSSLSIQIAWIMELLESNLEAKSKLYRDQSQGAIFLMNNNRYILQKARDGELGILLGDDWIRKQSTKVRQYQVNYQRGGAWGKVLGALKMDGGSSSMGSSVGPASILRAVKEKLKVFNMYFEENCKAQTGWVVVDEQLRTELRISIAGNVVPAYRNFLGKFQNFLEGGKNAEKYVKYSVEGVESRINGLFQGGTRK